MRRNLLNVVPRADAHPTHAVVDGVTYPGGLGSVRLLRSRYLCPDCGHEWESVWDSGTDEPCPAACGARDITPWSVEEMEAHNA